MIVRDQDEIAKGWFKAADWIAVVQMDSRSSREPQATGPELLIKTINNAKKAFLVLRDGCKRIYVDQALASWFGYKTLFVPFKSRGDCPALSQFIQPSS